MVKISDVAALAEVSPAVVSRVLSGDKALRVSVGTRERVIAAARELDYVPNHAAQSLRTARAGTVALVIPDVTSAVFAELTQGAEEEAMSRGLAIMLGRGKRLQDDSEWLRRLVGEGRIDGVILQPPDGTQSSDLTPLAAQDTPIVVINSVDDGPLSTIVLDDGAGIRLAVDHLRSLGHIDIGFVGGLPRSATGGRRKAAFLSAIAASGLHANDDFITDFGYAGADGRVAAAHLLESGRMPTGLVVANLNAALGLLAEIHSRNLRVPADISIVAMHDVWYADATWPPITTVRMPLSTLGSAAVALLADGDAVVTHTVIGSPRPQLVVRQSTARPPVQR